MGLSLIFFVNSVLLGIGLAMDAFSVSLANGLHEPGMTPGRTCLIAGTFGFFQIMMPLVGWFCVSTIEDLFSSFQKYIPWIALLLLLYIGGKMLLEGVQAGKGKSSEEEIPAVGFFGLLVQGIATSIDALSVGFTIADCSLPEALLESLIIGVVTFCICVGGLRLGKRFGTKLSWKASVLGGCILVFIGVEIFVTHVF
ncbi:MAG: manganese efflux pump MntP family protein [Oscillospiraceae bacterium]|nr:manganese efflux pump MntP family protein [Oscillospiraceae bacterium]